MKRRIGRRMGQLAVCAGIAAFAWTAPALAFTDVAADHPYAAAIEDLSTRRIIGGYPDGTFRPEGPAWRQHFAKMIVLTLGMPVTEGDACPFPDVDVGGVSTLYPDNYVAAAAAAGITLGTGGDRFSPTNDISRVQVVSMVVRGLSAENPDLLQSPSTGFESTWSDIDPTHLEDVLVAESNGLLDGLGTDVSHPQGGLERLDPYGAMPRGELAQVLHNALWLIEGSEPSPPPPPPVDLQAIHSPSAPLEQAYRECGDCHDLNLMVEHVVIRGRTCETCHGSTAPASVQDSISGFVTTGEKQGCTACHGANAGDHPESAERHTAREEASCKNCHFLLLTREHDRGSSSSARDGCANCHPLPAGFQWTYQCDDCHAAGGIAPPKHPQVEQKHSSASCSCHGNDVRRVHGCSRCHSTAKVPTTASCTSCHGADPHEDGEGGGGDD